MFILMNWRVLRANGPDGVPLTRVSGQVYGHPAYRPGDDITTSTIATYRVESDFIIITTVTGSSYSLEKPLATEPFARQRLMRYLDEQPIRSKSKDSLGAAGTSATDAGEMKRTQVFSASDGIGDKDESPNS